MKEKFLGVWEVFMIGIPLIAVFLVIIPYWIKSFDTYLPSISLGMFRYFGMIIFLAGASLAILSIFILTKMAGGIPLSRLRGGTPPRLVTTGPYAYVRHSQQLGGIMMLLGLAIHFESLSIFIYAVVGMILSHIHVIFVEEPSLKRTFGKSYEKYREVVPRYIPRFHRIRKR